MEWNYGDYEGKRRPEILAERPDWIIFRDGCPNGESPEDVAVRADRFHFTHSNDTAATSPFSRAVIF